MALGDSYATLPELKAYMFQSIQDTDVYDGTLTDALASVSREIETHCDRQFNKAESASVREYDPDRVFTLRDGSTVIQWAEVDDFWDTAGLVIDSGTDFGTAWTATDYKLYPRNGILDGQPGWPFWKVYAKDPSSLSFGSEGLRVTAKWGWAAVPTPVKQACLILAAETFQIKDAPFGVAGMDQYGVIRVRDNRMAAAKLAPYRRDPIKVG